jgi:hypothetical protein
MKGVAAAFGDVDLEVLNYFFGSPAFWMVRVDVFFTSMTALDTWL